MSRGRSVSPVSLTGLWQLLVQNRSWAAAYRGVITKLAACLIDIVTAKSIKLHSDPAPAKCLMFLWSHLSFCWRSSNNPSHSDSSLQEWTWLPGYICFYETKMRQNGEKQSSCLEKWKTLFLFPFLLLLSKACSQKKANLTFLGLVSTFTWNRFFSKICTLRINVSQLWCETTKWTCESDIFSVKISRLTVGDTVHHDWSHQRRDILQLMESFKSATTDMLPNTLFICLHHSSHGGECVCVCVCVQ